MYFVKNKKFLGLLMISVLHIASCYPLTQEAREQGFVYLHEVDPTIQVSLRYHSDENFVGIPIKGYKKSVVILTEVAAQALKKVQEDVQKDDYCLVVYDAYRPQQAVDHFIEWGKDIENQAKKSYYYPAVSKADAFRLGYIATRSGHSRGSTVDLTLIKNDKHLHKVIEKKRTLLDGSTILLLDDGTVDMGSSFDLFGIPSHYENDLIPQEFKKLRTYLKQAMEKHNFRQCPEEWWHFTLRNEPFSAKKDSSYFNFSVE